MKKHAANCRRAGRAIHDLMGRLVEVRLARSPGADESGVRRDIWRALRDHARLDDPNRLDAANSSLAVWVLTALLEMEADAGREGAGEG
jgi:hypothetical protein